MHNGKRLTFLVCSALTGATLLATTGIAAAEARPSVAAPHDATALVYEDHGSSTWVPGGGRGAEVQDAADRVIFLQCDPPGGWGWPLFCPPEYNNITAPICLGLLAAYDLTADAPTLNAAIAGGDFDLTVTTFGSHTPYFLHTLSGAAYANDGSYSSWAAVKFYDELTAGTYGPSTYDTVEYLDNHKAVRSGAYINLRPWDMQYMPWTAGQIGNATSGPADATSQQQRFLDAVLDGLDTLDDAEYFDLGGLAGGVKGLALNGTTTFPAINSPNFTAIDTITDLCDLADVLVGFQNANGSWYWNSTLGSPGASDEDTQVTAYAVLALLAAQAQGCGPYATEIALGRAWLASIQDGITGGFPTDGAGGAEYAEPDGEVLNAMSAATPVQNIDTSETFTTIQAAHDDADTLDGHTLQVLVDAHSEGPQVHITKDLTIKGGSPNTILATGNTSGSGDARGWFLVDDGVVLHVQNLIFDGNGYDIYQAFRHKGSGSFTNCGFTDIKFPTYAGVAIVAFGDDGPVDVSGCTFDQIGRVGVLYFGSGITGSVYSGNVYTGKGDGDWLDYGVELGAGAVATVTNSTITDCRGVASSDGSTSAGILATTYYGAGTAGTVTSTIVTANSTGIFVGYDGSDTTVLVANYNSIFDNTSGGLYSTAPLVDAEDNWWGDATGPEDLLGTLEADSPTCYDPDPINTLLDVVNSDGGGNDVSDGNVDYCPWLLAPATLSLNPDDTCYGDGVGDTVTVTIHMSDVKDYVVGGQFFLEYDNTKLDFLSANVGDAPFTVEVYEFVDEFAGTIDYAVGAPSGDPGTPLPTDMAVLTFEALVETCGTANLVTFRSHDPPTRLTNEYGDHIGVVVNNLPAITIDDTAPTFDTVSCPLPDIDVNADAGTCEAAGTTVNPTVLTTADISDNCDPNPSLTFDRDDGKLLLTDPYEAADSPIIITWTATDDCDNFSECTQTVIVQDLNTMVVNVELDSAPVTGTRCITFELFESCSPAVSVVVDADIFFTSGWAIGAVVDVPCGAYVCITGRDKLHTLRRTDDDGDFYDAGTSYVADFTSTGTTDDSLLGGNLNDDRWIDILDYGVFTGQWAVNYGSPDTPCGTPYPHADISGNSLVATEEFTFIQTQFLFAREADCCGVPMRLGARNRYATQADGPVTRISVKELRRRGLHDLIKGDLNHDGWLDVRDMEAFANGARP
jgi:hypothetical protein